VFSAISSEFERERRPCAALFVFFCVRVGFPGFHDGGVVVVVVVCVVLVVVVVVLVVIGTLPRRGKKSARTKKKKKIVAPTRSASSPSKFCLAKVFFSSSQLGFLFFSFFCFHNAYR
jgi:hypothetical protein